MGVNGLLPMLKSIQRPTEIRKYSGQVFGIDAYGWLHRGAFGCAGDLALGKPTRRHVDFALRLVRMFQQFGVTPYLVFDGDFLPSKSLTEASRERTREAKRKAGMDFLKAGKRKQAYYEFQKAIDVTPEMAGQFIEELKEASIPYIVAPYEADAQLVYLERHGFISGIVSEDSDLLVFGAKRLLTKMDQQGRCVEINRGDFCAVTEISLTGWTDDQFRQMAIFSGCDYVKGVGGMGLKTAHRMMRKYKTPECVIRMLQLDSKFHVAEDYSSHFQQAELTFLHQRVFCPKQGDLVLLTEPHVSSTLDIEELPFIGARLDRKLAKAIAVGEVNPITKETIVVTRLPVERSKTSTITKTPVAQVPGRATTSLGKSINSYIQNRRIPMGEMDRNCFSLDRNQVTALTQNGLMPRVFPLPRPYLDRSEQSQTHRPYSSTSRRQTEPILRTLSDREPSIVPSTIRRRTTAPIRRISDAPGRPPKKARLCEDDRAVAMSDQLPQKSLYFTPRQPTIQSQDSDTVSMAEGSSGKALDSLLNVPGERNVPRTSGHRQSLQVPRNRTSPGPLGESERVGTEDQESIPENSTSKSELNQERAAGYGGSRKSFKAFVDEFSYTHTVPASENGARMALGRLTSTSSNIQGAEVRAVETGTPLQTPLQRIGAQALLRGKYRSLPWMKADSSAATFTKRQNFNDLESSPINPAFIPLRKRDLAELQALNTPGGSEDQVIPDSDEEDNHHIAWIEKANVSSSQLHVAKSASG